MHHFHISGNFLINAANQSFRTASTDSRTLLCKSPFLGNRQPHNGSHIFIGKYSNDEKNGTESVGAA
jgi:hypothetical protein